MEFEALLVTSATLVAVMEYTPGVEGATKVAKVEVTLEKLPQEVPEQDGPEADHVTPAEAMSF